MELPARPFVLRHPSPRRRRARGEVLTRRQKLVGERRVVVGRFGYWVAVGVLDGVVVEHEARVVRPRRLRLHAPALLAWRIARAEIFLALENEPLIIEAALRRALHQQFRRVVRMLYGVLVALSGRLHEALDDVGMLL